MCNCPNVINEQLKKHNLKVRVKVLKGTGQVPRVIVDSSRIHANKKAGDGSAFLVADYCPWCGERYNNPEAD